MCRGNYAKERTLKIRSTMSYTFSTVNSELEEVKKNYTLLFSV